MFKLSLSFFTLLIFSFSWVEAAIDFGVGTSSVTAGRPVASLALGYQQSNWGLLFRSEGVQTKIYAQNAWTVGLLKNIGQEKIWGGDVSLSGGLGTTYILRAYKESLTAVTEKQNEYAVGPHFYLRYQLGIFYFGFDTVLGISSSVAEHIVLNFQDVSHFSFGFSL